LERYCPPAGAKWLQDLVAGWNMLITRPGSFNLGGPGRRKGQFYFSRLAQWLELHREYKESSHFGRGTFGDYSHRLQIAQFHPLRNFDHQNRIKQRAFESRQKRLGCRFSISA